MTTHRTRRRAAPLLLAALLIGFLPASVRAASPVAVDDPNPLCQDPSTYGGSFPIPEDWNGGTTGFERDFLFAGGITCGLLQNDSDADLDTLAIASVSDGPHGTAFIVDPVSVAYRPDKDWSTPAGDWVSDTFTYQATDGETTSNTATMSIWLAPINDPPTFTPGPAVTVDPDSGAYSAAWASAISPGPANEGSQTVSFQVVSVNDGGVGLFASGPTVASDGTLSFTPAAGKIGIANVKVEAHDDGGLEDYGLPAGDMDPPDDTSGQVTFQIAVIPDAVDDTTTTNEDQDATVDVIGNDDVGSGGSVVVTSASNPAKGTATVAQDGSDVLYSPDPDANGTDSFTYTITGGDTATVHVTITPAEDDPVADDDTLTLLEDATATTVNVLTGDTDPDGDPLHVSAVTDGTKGDVTISGNELSVSYDPNANANGSDSFTYDVDDGNGGTDTGTVAVTITPVNDVPSFSHGSLTQHEDEDVAGDVAGWASSISTGPSNESAQTPTFLVTGNSNPSLFSAGPSVDATSGDLTWTPAANAHGSATVQVAVKDDGGTTNGGDDTSDAVTLTITVDATNDVPSATTDSAAVNESARSSAAACRA